MEAYHDDSGSGQRAWITVPWRLVDGRMVPVWPDGCPWARPGVECRLAVNHYRERTTGPGHRLLVLECSGHGRAFTLYPLGHVPYGQAAVAPVDEAGSLLMGKEVWAATLFVAALNAALGDQWPRDCPGDDRRRWRTQQRYVERAAMILGLADGGSESGDGGFEAEVARLAALFDLAGQDLLDARSEFAAGTNVVGRGKAVAGVLKRIVLAPCVLDAVLAGGARAGLWGPPVRWQQGQRHYLYPPSGTPP